jgi:hypothetical protein
MEKQVQYVTQYNSRALIVSLQKRRTGLTIFFHHVGKTFQVVHRRICIDEGFLDWRVGDVNILQDLDNQRQYLYDDNGVPLDIAGAQIELVKGGSVNNYNKSFVVAMNGGTFDIYSDKLALLVTGATSWDIVGEWYCIYEKDGKKHVSHTSKGNLLPNGFDTIEYFKDKYYSHNDMHFFMLGKQGAYGLYYMRDHAICNNFDWEDYRAQDRFDYLYYKQQGQWHQLELYGLTSRAVEQVVFEQRIRI